MVVNFACLLGIKKYKKIIIFYYGRYYKHKTTNLDGTELSLFYKHNFKVHTKKSFYYKKPH